jgi:hypothetical protein
MCSSSYAFIFLSGTQYTQQSYKFSDAFPFKWINKKWKEGFYVTSMATAGSCWGVVMSRNAGYSNQVRLVEGFSGFNHPFYMKGQFLFT